MKYNAMSILRFKNNDQKELSNRALMQNILKRANKRRPKIAVKSLSDEPHYLVPESNYESVYEFWIEEAQGRTDEELQEYCDEMEVHNNTPYDCSGLLCTAWIQYHRNPSGLVSFIHKRNLDV